MDHINGSICIFTRSFCMTDQVIMRRSLRVCERCGIKSSIIVESQTCPVPIDHRSCGAGYRAGSRTIPYSFCTSDLIAVLVFPSYVDSSHIYIVFVAVIGRVFENNIRCNCLIINVRSASRNSQAI